MMERKKEVLSKVLFYTLVFLLPINLGYHFELKESYLNGILIDYLIPTLYVQDILALVLVLLNVDTLYKNIRKVDKYLVWFLFSVFLASISSAYIYSSMTYFTRLLIYILVMLVIKYKYADKEMFKKVVHIFGVSTILLSILAILQWRGQGSVFDNYLFFGEQPYNIATPGINVENFMEKAKVPPYGTFRHPNTFGGILSIVLIWFLFFLKGEQLTRLALVLGVLALFFTLSIFSWLSFVLGVCIYLLLRSKRRQAYKIGLVVTALSVLAALLLPYLPYMDKISEKPSYYRRAHLLNASYRLIGTKPFFGVGYGVSTAYIDKYLPPKHDIRFAQPPHNIFVMLLTEAGVLSLMFFTLVLFKKVKQARNKPVLFVSLMQIVFLGMFDHYFFTMQQPQLLLWLIVGFI